MTEAEVAVMSIEGVGAGVTIVVTGAAEVGAMSEEKGATVAIAQTGGGITVVVCLTGDGALIQGQDPATEVERQCLARARRKTLYCSHSSATTP